jgi:hypothetical protein
VNRFVWLKGDATLRTAASAAPFAFDPDQPRVPAGSPEGGEWASGTGGGPTVPPVPPTALARYYHSTLGYIADNGPATAGELAGHLGDRHRLGAAKARAVVDHLASTGDLSRAKDGYGRDVLGASRGPRTKSSGREPDAGAPPAAAGREAHVLDFAARAGQHPGGLAPVWELKRQLRLSPDDLKGLLFRLDREDKIRLVAVGDRGRLTREQLRDSVEGENETFAYVGPGPAHPTAPFAADAPDLSGLGDLLNLSRQDVLDALFDAATDSFDLALPDAAFYSPDQPRVPAGSPGGGRWAGGVSPGTAAARDAASDAVRAFASGQGPATRAEAEALAGHLARLTVAQIHALKAEHGLRGSAPNKAALVAKLAGRFRAHRERNPVATEAPDPAPAVKQPWEMTRARYQATGGVSLPEDHPLMQEAERARAALRGASAALLAAAPQYHKRTFDTPTKQSTIGAAMEYEPRSLETALKSSTVPRAVKDQYRAAKEAQRQVSDRIDEATDHRAAVESALAGGKPVPPKVLADYPDLAAKAAPPPPAPPPAPAGLHEVRPGGRPFRPGEVHVEVAAGGGDAARRVFGRGVDLSLFPAMANAAPGWNVLVTPDPFTGGVAVSSFGPGGNASRSFRRRADGKLEAHNESFRVHDDLPGTGRPNPLKGQGLRLFTNQVNALREAGVDVIRTHAAGEPGGSQNGYYTWPRFGFSGTMEDDAFGRLPSGLRERLGDSREVRDLFDLPGGAEAWKDVGSSVYNARFDLTPGSRNMRALEDYTREREARGK